jgi:hypothetical protein
MTTYVLQIEEGSYFELIRSLLVEFGCIIIFIRRQLLVTSVIGGNTLRHCCNLRARFAVLLIDCIVAETLLNTDTCASVDQRCRG